MSILGVIFLLFRALFRDRSQLALENLALRQQLAVLHRKARRPRLRAVDPTLWLSVARVWGQWCLTLVLVTPETVLRWQRQRFRYFGRIFRNQAAGSFRLRNRCAITGGPRERSQARSDVPRPIMQPPVSRA